jgi:hypothetical protein
LALGVLLTLAPFVAGAQDDDNLLQILRRNFAIGSLDVKIQVIDDAASMERGGFGPLYDSAIAYVLDNASLWLTDTRFTGMARRAVQQIGIEAYAPSQYSMFRLFLEANEPTLQIDITQAWIKIVESGAEIDRGMVAEINRWLEERNAEFRSGQFPSVSVSVSVPVLSAVIDVLGAFGDESSFAPLFSALYLGYVDEVGEHAQAALAASGGPLAGQLRQILLEAPFEDKLNAYRMALASTTISDAELGDISERALEIGLSTVTRDAVERAVTRELRFLAVAELVELEWARAAPLAIDNFNTVLEELGRGLVGRERLLQAISFAAVVGTRDAAARLSQYLVLSNSLVEGGGSYDELVLLALVDALEALGDSIAADGLIYVSYLDYSGPVKVAARRAFESLKF